MATLTNCAWCNASFSSVKFDSVGSWFLASPDGIRFYATPRSAGGGCYKMEQYYITGLTQMPSARRVSPWPGQRRLCSWPCLKSAKRRELRELQTIDKGGPVFRSVVLSGSDRRSRSPPRSPSPTSTSPSRPSSQGKYVSWNMHPSRLSEDEVGRLLSSVVVQEKLALSNATRKPRSRVPSLAGSTVSLCSELTTPGFLRITSGYSVVSSADGGGPKDMGHWLGLLKVQVIQGDQLLSYNAGEGVISYDKSAANPICFLSWGTLRAMSGCVKHNISPEWNEEFLFDVFQGNLRQKHHKGRREAGYMESIIQKEEEEEEAKKMAEQRKYVKTLEKMKAAEIYHPPKPPWLRVGTEVGAETRNSDSRMDAYWPVIGDGPKDGLLRVEVIHQGIDNGVHKHLGYADIDVGKSIHQNDTSLQIRTARLESSSEEWGVCGTIVISYQFEPAKRCENLKQREDSKSANWWRNRSQSTPPLRSRAHTPAAYQSRPRSQLGASPSPNGRTLYSTQTDSLKVHETEEESELVLLKEVCVRVRGWDRTHTRPIRLNHGTGIQGHTTPNTNRKQTTEKVRLNRLLRYYLDKCQKDLAYRALAKLERMELVLEEETKKCIVRNEHLWSAGGLWTDEVGLSWGDSVTGGRQSAFKLSGHGGSGLGSQSPSFSVDSGSPGSQSRTVLATAPIRRVPGRDNHTRIAPNRPRFTEPEGHGPEADVPRLHGGESGELVDCTV